MKVFWAERLEQQRHLTSNVIYKINCTIFQFSGNAMRGWCTVYECPKEGTVWMPLVFLGAALIFSPWTVIDGCIGAFMAQISGMLSGKYVQLYLKEETTVYFVYHAWKQ